MVFVEHLTHFYVYVSQRSQIQFEDEDHAIDMSFRWVTTTCLRWEPRPVTLWLYPVGVSRSWLSLTLTSDLWCIGICPFLFIIMNYLHIWKLNIFITLECIVFCFSIHNLWAYLYTLFQIDQARLIIINFQWLLTVSK